MHSYADSAMALVPPILAITLAIVSRKVLLSLGVGILSAALLLNDFNLVASANYVVSGFWGQVWVDGALNLDKLYTLGFLLLLGMITALINVSGATRAFALWAQGKLHNARQAKLLTLVLGLVIFVDDYFNSLVVGSVSRPITDHYKISRANLAYLLDSTAAPICVLSPMSSWGAYIVALVGGLLASHGMSELGSLSAFVKMIPMNFYAVFALLMLAVVSYWNLDVGPMRKHAEQAKLGVLYDEKKGVPPGATDVLPQADGGRKLLLFVPILSLVVATFSLLIWTGAGSLAKQGLEFSFMGALENTHVGYSLFFGALSGLVITLALVMGQQVKHADVYLAVSVGLKSMLPAVYILVFAWTISHAIGDMQTGKYLASLAAGSMASPLLPVFLFLLAGAAAFSTGTSWGTFGIMLPIAADMAVASDPTLMLPMLSAVLAGAVFGDHCSPISDTTILSSTGANCHHIDHVLTQLPYALIVALVSAVGFVVLGFSHSLGMAFVASSVVFVLCVMVMRLLCRSEAT